MDDQHITRYTPLVRAIARRYPLPAGWERADIEQEGMIGLLNASRRYDPDGLHRNYPFPTVASFAIKTQIRKALRTALGVEPPEIEEPTPAPDIADQPTMPLPIRPPAWMLGRDTRPLPVLSLDELPEIEVSIPGPSVEEQATISATLDVALTALTERQRIVITLRYGLPPDDRCLTQAEIAGELGVHQSTVSRDEARAMTVLRRQLAPTMLRPFEEKRQQRRAKARAA